MHGATGILAGVLFVLPSLGILIVLTSVYLAYGDLPVVAGLPYGIKPGVTAIVVFAAWRIGSRALRNVVLCAIAAGAFVAIFTLNIPFPRIVLGTGLVGLIGGRIAPDKFNTGGGHEASNNARGPALIDDHTPAPAHARFSWPRTLVYSLVGLAIWGADGGVAVCMLRLARTFDPDGLVLHQGGAGYLRQGLCGAALCLSGRRRDPQLVDRAADDRRPGPGGDDPGTLITVVAFVGFVGAWTEELLGPEAQRLAGIARASVATVFTFLPSFLFILIGTPAVEATRQDLKFTAPLTSITARWRLRRRAPPEPSPSRRARAVRSGAGGHRADRQ